MLQLSRVDWRQGAAGLGAVIVLVACIWGLSAWRHSKTADPLRGLKPGVYQSTHSVSGETLPLPVAVAIGMADGTKHVYIGSVNVVYKAVQGKSGKAWKE